MKRYIRYRFNECILFILFFFILGVSIPLSAFAQAYGSGSYGGGLYGTGDAGGSSSNTVVNAVSSAFASVFTPSCGNRPPGNQPQWLYAAIPQSGSISLYFTDASSPYDHYVVRYGLSTGNYMFGLDNAGGRGTRIVTINALLPNTTYYFQVRAGNACATGPWSNEISASTGSIIATDDLLFTSTKVTPQTNTQLDQIQPKGNVCQPYIVQSGDTLSGIAKKILHDRSQYAALAKLNEQTYPSLARSPSLSIGWKLQLPCAVTPTPTPQPQTQGYDVNVSVKDTKNMPVAGAKVTLHSTAQTAVTDKSGLARFHGIEKGQHQILIAYAKYQGQENVNLQGDVKTFNVNVQVKPVAFTFSPTAIAIIIILIIIIAGLIFLIIRQQKKVKRIVQSHEEKEKRYFNHSGK